MKRIVVLGVAASVLVGGIIWFLGTRRSETHRTIDVGFSDIVKVQAWPVPEGTPPPPLLETPTTDHPGTPLSEVRADVPSPFPAPVRCDPGPDGGLKLTVVLRDGRHLHYLSCAFPGELESLYEHAWV